MLGGLVVALSLAGLSCERKLAIEGLDFKVMHDPIQGKIMQGETVVIRCRIEPEEWGMDPKYTLRYVQPEGKGKLWVDSLRLVPGGGHPLGEGDFVLRYLSEGKGKHVLDITVSEPYGKERTMRIEFEHDDTPLFTVTHLPLPPRLLRGQTVAIKCHLAPQPNAPEGKYWLRYAQPEGQGRLALESKTLIPNAKVEVPVGDFTLEYTSDCAVKQLLELTFVNALGSKQVVEVELEHDKTPPFVLTHLPVPEKIMYGKTVEIKCHLEPAANAPEEYLLFYSQPKGMGKLLFTQGEYEDVLLVESEYVRHKVSAGDFKLKYTSDSKKSKQVLKLLVEDRMGYKQAVELTFEAEEERFPKFSIRDFSRDKPEVEKGEKVQVKMRLNIEEGDFNVSSSYQIRFSQVEGHGRLYYQGNEHSLTSNPTEFFSVSARDIKAEEIVMEYESLRYNIEEGRRDCHAHEVRVTIEDNHKQVAHGSFTIPSAIERRKFDVNLIEHSHGHLSFEFNVDGDPDLSADSPYTIAYEADSWHGVRLAFADKHFETINMEINKEYPITYKSLNIVVLTGPTSKRIDLKFVFRERVAGSRQIVEKVYQRGEP